MDLRENDKISIDWEYSSVDGVLIIYFKDERGDAIDSITIEANKASSFMKALSDLATLALPVELTTINKIETSAYYNTVTGESEVIFR